MSHPSPPPLPTESHWRTLMTLLAAPLAVSAVLVGIWLAGGRRPLDPAAADQVFASAGRILSVLYPLSMTWMALRWLRNPAERALVWPTPIMMYLAFSSRSSSPAWYWTALGNLACVIVLGACSHGRRRVAAVAIIVCGGIYLLPPLRSIVWSSP